MTAKIIYDVCWLDEVALYKAAETRYEKYRSEKEPGLPCISEVKAQDYKDWSSELRPKDEWSVLDWAEEYEAEEVREFTNMDDAFDWAAANLRIAMFCQMTVREFQESEWLTLEETRRWLVSEGDEEGEIVIEETAW
jgi:hypothetical protein